MKKFLIKLLAFFLLLVTIDFFYGIICDKVLSCSKGGFANRCYYINKEVDTDVLIFGSSRCSHHYNSTIISDSLSMSVYNCGEDGYGILLAYPRFLSVVERYTPKMVIYDVYDQFDLLKGTPDDKYLMGSRPFAQSKGIIDVMANIDKSEKVKNISSLYRYNGWPIPLISGLFDYSSKSINGYRPSYNQLDYKPDVAEQENDEQEDFEYDDLKLFYLEQLIKDCKKNSIEIVLAISPMYRAQSIGAYKKIQELTDKYDISFYNDYCDNEISNNRSLWGDLCHLNHDGADLYSQQISQYLKQVFPNVQ